MIRIPPARHFAPTVTLHAYWAVVFLPLLLPAAWALRGVPGFATLFAWMPVLVLFVILPLADTWLGRDRRNPKVGASSVYPDVLIPVAAAAVYGGVLVWALLLVGREGADWGWLAVLGWTISLGDVGGVVAINVAHELIHRQRKSLQRLGGVLLSCVCYAGFKVEHPRWHHVKVATPDDPSSAPLGSTVYRRVPRAWWLNTIRAWKLAAQAARDKGRRLWWVHHELTGWWALSAGLLAGFWLIGGPLAGAVFLAQGLVAAALLEVINYIEHYGLRRRLIDGGRYEPPRLDSSWNAEFWLSNAILLQLQRHSDHHVHPRRSFSQLQSVAESPQLPLGYAALSVLALVPPLWRRVIHPHLPDQSATR